MFAGQTSMVEPRSGPSPDIPVVSTVVAFDDWYVAQYSAAVRFAYLLCHDTADAEDLAQDAFIAASRRWHQIGGYERPDLWVRRAIANRANNRLRKLYRGTRAMARLETDATFTVDLTSRTEDAYVLAALARLPDRQRVAVALTYLEDMDLIDVAAVLGCSPETARTHRRRGEDRLRMILTAEHDNAGK